MFMPTDNFSRKINQVLAKRVLQRKWYGSKQAIYRKEDLVNANRFK